MLPATPWQDVQLSWSGKLARLQSNRRVVFILSTSDALDCGPGSFTIVRCPPDDGVNYGTPFLHIGLLIASGSQYFPHFMDHVSIPECSIQFHHPEIPIRVMQCICYEPI